MPTSPPAPFSPFQRLVVALGVFAYRFACHVAEWRDARALTAARGGRSLAPSSAALESSR
jgi:hypothetical protein